MRLLPGHPTIASLADHVALQLEGLHEEEIEQSLAEEEVA